MQVGYGKEVISRGKFAELLQDYRPFNEDEKQFFDESAQFAYESFRDRAAESRGMAPEEMQELAQGRVWSGHRALGNKCAPPPQPHLRTVVAIVHHCTPRHCQWQGVCTPA